MNLLVVVVSTSHIAVKFSSSSRDVIMVYDDQKTVKELYIASLGLPAWDFIIYMA